MRNPIYWATQGYVVLDRAEFPIVGEGDMSQMIHLESNLLQMEKLL